MAMLWAIVMSHVDSRPRAGSYRAPFRHAAMNTSCVNSSAASLLPNSRNPIVNTGRPNLA